MAWVRIPGYHEVTGPLKEFWRAYRERNRGEVANILRLQGLNPRSLLAHYELYQAIMFSPSPVSRQERELAAVAVSWANRCHY